VVLAAAHGIKLEVTKRETAIDPIQVLFVCVRPDGPSNLAATHGRLTKNYSSLIPSRRLQKGMPTICCHYWASEFNRLGVSW
jgi:hypothetical protein